MDDLALALFYEKRLNEEKAIATALGDLHALRDIEAKMRILGRWMPVADREARVKDEPSPYKEMDIAEAIAIDVVVRVLVAVYRYHEDYDAEWAP